jgi:transcriptional regulator with XRE-family HTH domain
MSEHIPAELNEKMHFADNLKFLRKEKKLSLTELAELARVSTTQISTIENKRSSPTLEAMMQIAYALETSVIEMLKPCHYFAELSLIGIVKKYISNDKQKLEDLAKAIGVTEKIILNIEQEISNLSFSQLESFSSFFKIPVSKLLTREKIYRHRISEDLGQEIKLDYLASNLKLRCKQLNLKEIDLIKKHEISKATIDSIVKKDGKVYLIELFKLANALKTPLESLLNNRLV